MTTNDRRSPRWPARVFKTFGVLHIVFAVLGLYLVLSMAGLFVSWPDFFKRTEDAPRYRTEAYLLRTVINLIFLGTEGIAGLHLLRTRPSGTTISNVLFAAMIFYFLFPIWDLFGPAFSRAMAATAGTGNMGIGLQLVSGYPVLALVLLNLASRKLRDIHAREMAAA